MQLSQLVKRLNPEELAEFLSRHGIANGTTDADRIATVVQQRQHLSSIIHELNQPQLMIVRWLAQQEDFRAGWQSLLEALNGRIPESSLLREMHELRMFGLVDYVADPESGWLATYPAVASAQPISQGIDLASALNGMSTEMLQAMCHRFAISPIPQAKAKRIEALSRCLSDHNFVVFTLASLEPEALELFEWFMSRGGTADHNALALKLGEGYYSAISYVSRSMTGWSATNLAKGSPFIDLLERALVAGVSAYGNSWGYASYFAIPAEVATAYAGTTIFDTAPLTPPPLIPANPTQTRMPNMTATLRDVAHLRAFVSLGRAEWRQDGEPYARSLQTLSKLVNGPTKDYGSVLWKLAVDIPAVLATGDRGGDYIAADLSEARPDDLVRELIQGWSEERINTYYSEQELPQDAHRRVLALLPTMPPDVWIDRESFEDYLSFCWPLHFNARVKSANEHISGDWSALYATVLGYGLDENKRESFLIQPDGFAIVNDRDPIPTLRLPEWDTSWVVQPDRTIMAPPNAHPDSILDLWSIAELVENQGASIFRVSADSISGALNRGMTPDEISALFDEHSRTPLPATIERLIRDQSARFGQVRVGNATAYLQVDDPEVLDEITSNAKLKGLRIDQIAPTAAIVHGADEGGTIAALRRAGYLPTRHQTSEDSDSQLAPTTRVQSLDEIKVLLRHAVMDQRIVRIRIKAPSLPEFEVTVGPEKLRRADLVAYDVVNDDLLEIPLKNMTFVTQLSAAESRKYYQ